MSADASGAIPWISEANLLGALSVGEAADALIAALHEPDGLPEAPQRTVIRSGSGQFLAMPVGGAGGAGAKLVTVQPSNPPRGLPLIQGVFVLFSADWLAPIAIVDGAALTRLRSPAVSVVATRLLAREDSAHLVLFGAGVQARAHGHAMLAERPLERITVVSRGSAADDLVGELGLLGVDAARGDSSSVAEADIVCTCTTAPEPLFDGRSVSAGAHVNAMGSFQPTTREIDELLLARSTVVVEDREAALSEAGDLRIPLESGAFSADAIAGDLRDVVSGRVRRTAEDEITTFKSVGAAWEDMVVAQAAWDRIGRS